MNQSIALTAASLACHLVGIAPHLGWPASSGQTSFEEALQVGCSGRISSRGGTGIHQIPRVWCCCSIPEPAASYGLSLHGMRLSRLSAADDADRKLEPRLTTPTDSQPAYPACSPGLSGRVNLVIAMVAAWTILTNRHRHHRDVAITLASGCIADGWIHTACRCLAGSGVLGAVVVPRPW